MTDTHRRLSLTHLQVGQRNHPKRNLQKIFDITIRNVAEQDRLPALTRSDPQFTMFLLDLTCTF